MADVKISELAKTVGVSVDKLLSQIKEAGLPHVGPDELISNDDKNTLLVFLRRSHGDRKLQMRLQRKSLKTQNYRNFEVFLKSWAWENSKCRSS